MIIFINNESEVFLMIDKFLPVDALFTISTTSLKQKQTKNASRLCHMKKKIYSKKITR